MKVSFPFPRGRLIVPPVRIRHSEVYQPDMALDTGARLTVIAPSLAREIGLEPDGTELTVSITGATGTSSAVLLRVRSISVLGIEVRNVRVICHPLPRRLGLDGILGLNFLNRFNIEIDNETETVTMTRRGEQTVAS